MTDINGIQRALKSEQSRLNQVNLVETENLELIELENNNLSPRGDQPHLWGHQTQRQLNSANVQEVFSPKNDKNRQVHQTLAEKFIQEQNLSFIGYVLLKSFIHRLKFRSSFFRQNQLNSHDFTLIGDNSYFFKKDQNNILNKLKEKTFKQLTHIFDWDHANSTARQKQNILKRYLDNIPRIHPKSNIVRGWDMIYFVTCVFCVLLLPIEMVSYETFNEIYGSDWQIVISFCLIVFCFQMFLQLFLGFYDKGQLIRDPKKIRSRYLTQTFWVDLLSLVPLAIDLGSNFDYLNFLIFLKVFEIYRILKKAKDIFTQKEIKILVFIIKLTTLLVNILVAGHILAIIWLSIGHYEERRGNVNWISVYNSDVLRSEWFTRYAYALYWAITTMTTVGYVHRLLYLSNFFLEQKGDITPKNPREVVFVMFSMIMACFLFAYSFNQIGSIVEELNKEEKQLAQDLEQVGKFLVQNEIDDSLKEDIFHYLTDKYKIMSKMNFKQEQEVLDKLSESLQERVMHVKNKKVLKTFKMMEENFSDETLAKLGSYVQNLVLEPNEVIYSRYDQPDDEEMYIYFLQKGEVQLRRELSPSSAVQIINPSGKVASINQSYFGENGFFFGHVII